jgi:hypothetical protein
MNQFPAGVGHEVVVSVCNGVGADPQDAELLLSLNAIPIEYHGEGWDIGAHIHVANSLPADFDFAVFCSSQVYFHREGWLKRMVEAREQFGPGLYGGLASHEHRPHLRTCFFGCAPMDLRSYPFVVNSKETSLQFESGKNGFWSWIRSMGRKEVLVTWDACYDNPEKWREPENIFRRGDQGNCLAWDRHTKIYELAPPEEKSVLEQFANGTHDGAKYIPVPEAVA